MYWHFGSLSLRTIRQVEKSPAAPHTHTHTQCQRSGPILGCRAACDIYFYGSSYVYKLRATLLPRCRADCGFREQPAVRNFKGLFCLSLERQKGMKAAGMGCGVAGTFTSVSPSICPSVPLSSCRGANILCCVVVVVVVFGLVLFCVLVSKLLSHYYVYCSSFRLSFACRKLWALIPSCTLVSPITSRLHFIKVIAPINSATQTPEIPT